MQESAMKGKKVLIVEDNELNMKLFHDLLEAHGVETVQARDGKNVLALAREHQPDLILMDIRLPYEDGYGALKKIRASERFKSVPIIAVTAEASQEQMKKAKDSGFDGFLGKPLDPDRFPDQIRRILNSEPVWEFS